ncbi:MAG TPA: diacylglycerol kinase family protein [Syntrophomonadaceae bacterium]|nr:diacylglycerol kinase family protein [Syntrophomonadaceae bacterium]
MKKLGQSMGWALSGLKYTILAERNMKIHLAAALAVFALAGWLGLSRMEWGLLVLTVFLVLVAEMVNTSIEKTVDMVTQEYHPLAYTAKNVAAGAVLLAAVNAIIMGLVIFLPHLSR